MINLAVNWNKNLIALTSITYASKAKDLLNSYGFYCEIRRTPREFATGCGYSVVVRGDLSKILIILNNAGIVHKGIMEVEKGGYI